MLRSLYLFALMALLALGGVWLADNPGSVSVRWGDYVVETNMVVLAAAVFVLALVLALVINIYKWLRASPGRLGGVFANRRRSKGLDAISNGMVAIAAGHAEEARRAAIEAEKYLNGAPMALLLAAQAAELNKDARAAKIYYGRMTEQPETEFLGLRGLINQALAENDPQAALALAKRADEIKPGTDWVLKILLSLYLKTRDFDAATGIVNRSAKGTVAKDPAIRHLKAAIATEQARMAFDAGDTVRAAAFVKTAQAADPSFVPAAVLALQLVADDRKRDKLVAAIWADCPHPDVAAAIQNLVPLESEKDWYARAKHIFLTTRPDHRESLMALAKAAMGARDWGDARQYLSKLERNDPTVSVYRLLADLEEKANADAAAARSWIIKSTEARRDPVWTCTGCGRQEDRWVSTCPTCDRFDSFRWQNADHRPAGDVLEAEIVEEIPAIS